MSSGHYPEHPVTFRQELVAPLTKKLLAGESVAVIGAASMAKSNLVRFLLRPDVRQHYLGAHSANFIFCLVNTNRLEQADYAGYELILTSLVEAVEQMGGPDDLARQLADLHRELVREKDRLLGLRYLERAVKLLVNKQGWRVVLLLDEFDAFYKSADVQFLRCLRALRDEHKYRLMYVCFARTRLERLRATAEVEDFFELFNRNYLGLQPYQSEDAGRVLDQLQARKESTLPVAQRELLLTACAGHPGLLVAAFDALVSLPAGQEPTLAALAQDSRVDEECRKLWEGLDLDEQWSLVRLVTGYPEPAESEPLNLLELKGLVVRSGNNWQVFSPLFLEHCLARANQESYEINIDEDTASVWVSGKNVTDLSPLEFDLIKFLFRKRGKVCSRDEILIALYPSEFSGTHLPELSDNRVDNLIRRLRDKVEPLPNRQRLIRTVRGHGYMLAAAEESA